jgi:hypothetical protein
MDCTSGTFTGSPAAVSPHDDCDPEYGAAYIYNSNVPDPDFEDRSTDCLLDSIEIAPVSATWRQCGQNSDGTPYDEAEPPPMLMAAIRQAVGPSVKVNLRKPLPLAHPDRCRHLGKRTELRAGCNGWKCAHDCELGLPAVPGLACQSCEKYEPDPDYAGVGPAGWVS